MLLRRLSWAGIEARVGGGRLLVDPLEHTAPLAGFLGAPRRPLEPVPVDARTWAAVTHLHPDHYDRALLLRLPAGHVVCHEAIAPALLADGIRPTVARLWQPVAAGPFRLTAAPSHDWRGDDQVAWAVAAGGRRAIHCGDTIWHGGWYATARRLGPFDVAFLPINGVRARLEGVTPTRVPATLTPEQAVEAAIALQASTACAIHHGLFGGPRYRERPLARVRFLAAGRRRRRHVVAPADGGPCLPAAGWDGSGAPRL